MPVQTPPQDDLVLWAEAATELGIATSTLYLYLDRLQIERVKISSSRHAYLRRSDVQRIKELREHPERFAQDLMRTEKRRRRKAEQ